MARVDPAVVGQNLCAFLDMIAVSEIGRAMLDLSDDGYNVLQGSTPMSMWLFPSYDGHPDVALGGPRTSTAAGRYQLLRRYYQPYARMLSLDNFSPESQDRIAIQQIRECRAIPLIDAGLFDHAVVRCAHIWASLPGAGYGQHENTMSNLRAAYMTAGGSLSDNVTNAA